MWKTWVWCLSHEDPLEKGMVTHCSILFWRILWREEPGGLHSPWSHKESDRTEQLPQVNNQVNLQCLRVRCNIGQFFFRTCLLMWIFWDFVLASILQARSIFFAVSFLFRACTNVFVMRLERGPPTVGPPVPMLRIAPRLSCPRAHWSFLFLEFLGLPVHWMSVYHQSSYVKILTATWWY